MNKLNEILNNKGYMIWAKIIGSLLLILIMVAFVFGMLDNLLAIELDLIIKVKIGALSFVAVFSGWLVNQVVGEKAVFDEEEENAKLKETNNNIDDVEFLNEEDDLITDFINSHNLDEQTTANKILTQFKIDKLNEKIRKKKFKSKDYSKLAEEVKSLKLNPKEVKIDYVIYSDIISIGNESAKKIKKQFGRQKIVSSPTKTKWYTKVISLTKFIIPAANGVVGFVLNDWWQFIVYLLSLLFILTIASVWRYISVRTITGGRHLKTRMNKLELLNKARKYIDSHQVAESPIIINLNDE